MYLFDEVEDEYHECGVDNLYMSAKFCKDAYNHEKKIKLHGVTRKGGRGLPLTVIQQEVTNVKEQEKVRGTVIAAELAGDPNCPSLIAVSVYDTKPVHFLTMAAENIYWEENKREVFDRSTGKMKSMKFYRLNVNNDYNFGMGGVDIADQIRGSYRFDHWLRRYKWWHSVFWWGVQVLMVNSYQCYCKFYEQYGVKPMTHYKYQSMIACAWMDKSYYENRGGEAQYVSSSRSVSSMSTNTVESTRRAIVSDILLNPLVGALKCRLNTAIAHWPSPPPSSKFYCNYIIGQ